MTAVFDLMVTSADPAMAIVTTQAEDGTRAGCLVGFHGQSAMEPPHYAIWLSKANHTYRTALRSTHFAVHFLSVDDIEIATHFGTVTGEDEDKFAGFETDSGPADVPLLRDCPRRIVIERAALLDVGGDHACFTGPVVEADCPEAFEALRETKVIHLRPGHESQERAVKP